MLTLKTNAILGCGLKYAVHLALNMPCPLVQVCQSIPTKPPVSQLILYIYICHHRNDLLWFIYDDTQVWWCRLCIIVHSCNSPVNACHLTKYWFLRSSILANSGSRLWMQSSSLQLQLDACTCIHLKYQTPWQCMHAQAWCGSVNWKTLTRLNPARCNCN